MFQKPSRFAEFRFAQLDALGKWKDGRMEEWKGYLPLFHSSIPSLCSRVLALPKCQVIFQEI